jgi:betaine-aldehyde dehydrogenase
MFLLNWISGSRSNSHSLTFLTRRGVGCQIASDKNGEEDQHHGSKKENVIIRNKFFVGGEWVEPTGEGMIDVFNSTTEEVMGRVPEGLPEDADRAVSVARVAFPGWSGSSPEVRSKYLAAAAEKLKARQNEIAALIAKEVGMPLPLPRHPPDADCRLAYYQNAATYKFEDDPVGNAAIVRSRSVFCLHHPVEFPFIR